MRRCAAPCRKTAWCCLAFCLALPACRVSQDRSWVQYDNAERRWHGNIEDPYLFAIFLAVGVVARVGEEVVVALKDLDAWIERQRTPGVEWDSPEGRQLRRGGTMERSITDPRGREDPRGGQADAADQHHRE
jgi:hypothetical protein